MFTYKETREATAQYRWEYGNLQESFGLWQGDRPVGHLQKTKSGWAITVMESADDDESLVLTDFEAERCGECALLIRMQILDAIHEEKSCKDSEYS